LIPQQTAHGKGRGERGGKKRDAGFCQLLHLVQHAQVPINFWDSATKKRGKPHGVHGAGIRWAILDHAPPSLAAGWLQMGQNNF
jgi:hypothetical protein